jgi:hypothetical protein
MNNQTPHWNDGDDILVLLVAQTFDFKTMIWLVRAIEFKLDSM